MKQFLLCITIFFLNILTAESQSITGVVNSYYKVIKVNSANSSAKMADVTGLNSGTRVLLIQMKGATIDGSNSPSFGDISSINNAGKYELNTICGILNDTIFFKSQLLNNYDSGGAI